MSVFSAAISTLHLQQLDVARATNKDEWSVNFKLKDYLAAARQAMRKDTSEACALMTGGATLFTAHGGFETDLTTFSNHLHSRYD